ncbi:MAG: BACON domain-containing protein [Bacteroidales bacterium]
MKKRLKYFLPLVFLTGALTIWKIPAQQVFPQIDKIVPPSPTASGLGKFGEIPVGTYTGTPQIQVPLYTVPGKKVPLPITLSYHASGIKVDEIAGWVGLGWSLQAGGTIVRTVVGMPDDVPGGYLYVTSHQFPEAQSEPYAGLQPLQFDTEFDKYNYLDQLATGHIDGDPDVYSFHFAGHSGRFILDKNFKVRVVPHQNLKVTINRNTAGNIDSWKILDENGNLYRFGEREDCMEYNLILNDHGNIESKHISAWHLSTMASPNQEDEYHFSYSDHYSVHSYPVPVKMDGFLPPLEDLRKVKKTGHREKLLSEILFREGKLTFTLDTLDGYPGGYTTVLKEISLWDMNGICRKKFRFDYSFFPAFGCESSSDYLPPCRRPRLDKVTEYSGDMAEHKPPWWFFYEDIPLPPRGSFAQDLWGYYNGKANAHPVPQTVVRNFQNPEGIPDPITENGRTEISHLKRVNLNLLFVPETEWIVPGANREPDLKYARAGMIRKIVYPTGACTEFEFELHDYGYLAGISKRRTLVARAASKYDTITEESRNLFIALPQIITFQPFFGIEANTPKDQGNLEPDPASSITVEKYSLQPDVPPNIIYHLDYQTARQLPDQGNREMEWLLEPARYKITCKAYAYDHVFAVIHYQKGHPFDDTLPVFKREVKDTTVKAGERIWPDDRAEYVSTLFTLTEKDRQRVQINYYLYSNMWNPNNVSQTALDPKISYCRLSDHTTGKVLFEKYFIDIFPDDPVMYRDPHYWFKKGSAEMLLPPGTYQLEYVPRIPEECGMLSVTYGKFVKNHYALPAGGLRVKSLTSLDNAGDTLSYREYRYSMKDMGSFSSGVLMGTPRFCDLDEYQLHDVSNAQFGMDRFPLTLFSDPRNTLSTTRGGHIGYRRVEEVLPDSGRTVFHYTTAVEYPDISTGEFPFPPVTSFDWKRGLLTGKKVFDRNGNQRLSEIITYNGLDEDPNKTFQYARRAVYRKAGQYYPVYRTYIVGTGWNHPVEKVSEYRNPGQENSFTVRESFTYDPGHLQLKQVTTRNSDSTVTQTRYTYPDDMEIATEAIQKLREKHMVSSLLKREVWVNDVQTDGEKIHYGLFGQGKLVLPVKLEKWKGNHYEEQVTISQYDDYGNIREFTPAGGATQSIEWDPRGIYPMWKADNVGYRADLSLYPDEAMITRYEHEWLTGLTSLTDPNGITTRYRYDRMGRLDHVLDFEGNVLQRFQYHYKGYLGDTLTGAGTEPSVSYAPEPDTAWASPPGVNYTCPVQLFVSGPSLPAGTTWKWYEGGCGHTTAGTGESITVTPAASSTYYVRGEGSVNLTPCKEISVSVLENFIQSYPEEVEVSYAGSPEGGIPVSLIYTGCEPLSAHSLADWITIEACTDEHLVIAVGENDSEYMRTGNILVSGGGADLMIRVSQEEKPLPPELILKAEPADIAEGTFVTITATVENGTAPYSFLWERKLSGETSFSTVKEIHGLTEPSDILPITAPANDFTIRCTATTGGKTAAGEIKIVVMN